MGALPEHILKSSNKSTCIKGGRVSYFTMGLYGGHDLCNDIHKLEASGLAVCAGYAAIVGQSVKPLCM